MSQLTLPLFVADSCNAIAASNREFVSMGPRQQIRPTEGGCYCGEVRYRIDARPLTIGQCFCRACQHVSGGAQHVFLLIPPGGFEWTRGTPRSFTRKDLANAVTREFCAMCGTQIVTRRPGLDAAIVRIGTLDDPGRFGDIAMSIFTSERQCFHRVPPDIPAFPRLPERIP